MSASTEISEGQSERLVRRQYPLWQRLWARVLALVVLMWVVVGLFFWSNSRSAWAVFRVNGLAEPSRDSRLFMMRQSSGLVGYVSEFFIQDTDVTSVYLLNTAVDDQWLVRLQRFPRLEQALLDGGQIGPGLKNLGELADLKSISVVGRQRTVVNGWIDYADSQISGRHFLLIPQLESLALGSFKGTISDLDQLKEHPRLKSLTLTEIAQLGDVLKQSEECKNIESLSILSAAQLDEQSIESLCRMSHLKTLNINGAAKRDGLDSRITDALPTTSVTWGR